MIRLDKGTLLRRQTIEHKGTSKIKCKHFLGKEIYLFPIHNTAIIKSKHADLQCAWDFNRTVTNVYP